MKIQKTNTTGKFNVYLLSSVDDIQKLTLSGEKAEFIKNALEKPGSEVLMRTEQSSELYYLAAEGLPHSVKEQTRKAGSRAMDAAQSQKQDSLTIITAGVSSTLALAFAEGAALSSYKFRKYFTDKDKTEKPVPAVNIMSESVSDSDLKELSAVVESICIARDLVNEPQSYLTAEQFAHDVKSMSKKYGFKTEILDKQKIEKLAMGGILAVNQGSINPPVLMILTHKPKGAVNKKPVVLVGKGVTFDTGGLSLKPTPDSMDYMKCDMAGGAAVAATIALAAAQNLPVHLIGLIPATDNRPDGNAVAPGDVITMYSGTTVEVLNTDAEGRLILADALAYSKKFEPELTFTIATLTGAASVAIGPVGVVAMGDAERKWMDILKTAGDECYERIAEFPFWEEYGEMIKSDIADIKNLGGKYAGMITAGKFLDHFAPDNFIHLDIAGPAYLKSRESYLGKGGTGVGVRLFWEFLKAYANDKKNNS